MRNLPRLMTQFVVRLKLLEAEIIRGWIMKGWIMKGWIYEWLSYEWLNYHEYTWIYKIYNAFVNSIAKIAKQKKIIDLTTEFTHA